MFVEKININDIEKIAKKFDVSVVSFEEQINPETKNKELVVEFFNGAMGPQPLFIFSDFDAKSYDSYYKTFDPVMEREWRKLLYNKFGQEYLTALSNYFNNLSDEAINDLML